MFNKQLDTHTFSTTELENFFASLHSGKTQTYKKERPSASASLCQRQIALDMLLPPREIERQKSLDYYAEVGKAIETIALQNYRKSGALILSQWKMPQQLTGLGVNVGGIIDALISYKGEIVLIDIKTIGFVDSTAHINLNPTEVQQLMQGNDILLLSEDERVKTTVEKKLKEAHLAQLQLYAAITGLDNVYLQVMSRRINDVFNFEDTGPTVRFEQVSLDDATLKKRIAVVLYAQMCYERKLIPDKLAGIKKSHCSDAFCTFVDYCWKNGPIDTTGLTAIEKEEQLELKKLAFAMAETYISYRPQRREITMELITKEREDRVSKGVEI